MIATKFLTLTLYDIEHLTQSEYCARIVVFEVEKSVF